MSIFKSPEEFMEREIKLDKKTSWIGFVMMPPETFLSKVPLTSEEIEKESVDTKYYEKKIKRGEKLDSPSIAISSGRYGCRNEWLDHEGRHRAHLAQKLGESPIPIRVYWWHGYADDPMAKKILEDVPFSKQGDCWLGLSKEEIKTDMDRLAKVI